MSLGWLLEAIISLPSSLYSWFLGMLGLAVYPRQIIRIYPSTSAYLPLMTAKLKGGMNGTTHVENGQDEKGRVELNSWVGGNVPSLKGTFRPPWWLPNGHMQTIYSALGDFTKVDKVQYKRTYIRVPDGGTLALDFTPPSHDDLPLDTPIIVVCHGLTGGSHESYVRNVLAWAVRPSPKGLGARAVVVNFRGCAGTPVTSPQLYSAGTTIDLTTSLHYLRSVYPNAPLHGIGFSLGASVLSRYLGESSNTSLLSSGIVLGCPWSIPAMTIKLEGNWLIRKLYSETMAQNLLRLFFHHYDKDPSIFQTKELEEKVLPVLQVFRKKKRGIRLRDVDDVMTSQIGGPYRKGMWPFENADGYYKWASADQLIKDVKRPLLAINAFDDPIIDGGSLPIDEFTKSSHVICAITGSGGHLGWFDGPFNSKSRWILKPISEYLSAATRDLGIQGDDLEVRKGEEGWEYVDKPGYDIGQVVGWKVLSHEEIIEGSEDSGVLQGL